MNFNVGKNVKTFVGMQLRILEKPHIDCGDVERLMGEYVDHELGQTLSSRLQEHIKDCTHCQEFEAEYRAVIELAKQIKPITLSKDQQNRLRVGLNQRLGINLPLI